MISRFKSALLNAVSGTSGDDRVVNGNHNGTSSNSGHSSSSSSSGSSSSSKNSGGETTIRPRAVKYEYSRPHFLNYLSQDEILVSADHAVRPIIVPRDLNAIPWNVGYAETINSGKSRRNEDQARVHNGVLEFNISSNASSDASNEVLSVQSYKIPYKYFALFDGHAGPGAAVAAATQLHSILHEKLMAIAHHLIDSGPFCEVTVKPKGKGALWFPNADVTADALIIGALESAFFQMDALIEYENKHFDGVDGGCTAVVCVFIMNKVYVANAGDSRAILCRRNSEALALSNDFTPETERTRIRQLAAKNPELLAGEFTSNEYLRRPCKTDLGSKILYRAAHMSGWAYKTAEMEDLKFPVVFGQGKRSRVLATIGVTRGFGDHELSAHSTSARIKPFLSSQPEVKVVNVEDMEVSEDDVIVMGTDGLWDVTSNDTVASIVFSTVDQFPSNDSVRFKYRYTSAAQDLVMHARGKFTEKRNWRMDDGSAATIDDISVFVIPLLPFKEEIRDRKGFLVNSTEDTDPVLSQVNNNDNGLAASSVNGNPVQNGVDHHHPVGPETTDKQNNNSSAMNGNESEPAPSVDSSSSSDNNAGLPDRKLSQKP